MRRLAGLMVKNITGSSFLLVLVFMTLFMLLSTALLQLVYTLVSSSDAGEKAGLAYSIIKACIDGSQPYRGFQPVISVEGMAQGALWIMRQLERGQVITFLQAIYPNFPICK